MSDECYGRGIGVLAIHDVISLNKLVMQLLKYTGVRQLLYNPKSIPNPDNIKNVDGEFIPAKDINNAVKELPKGSQFQSYQEIARLQATLKKVFFDEDLPDLNDSVRSVYELQRRRTKILSEIGNEADRLQSELIEPLINIIVEVLTKKGLLEDISTDNNISIKHVTPITKNEAREEFTRLNYGIQMLEPLRDPETARNLNRGKYLSYVAKLLDLEPDVLKDEAQVREEEKQLAEQQAIQQQAIQAETAQKVTQAQSEANNQGNNPNVS